jgi:PAS domain S-box-containing protein
VRLESVRKARDFAARMGVEAGLSHERLFDLKVTVSEACANAVEHVSSNGNEEFEVELFRHDERLVVLVRSPSRFALTRDRVPQREEHRGFGLPFMAILADQLSIRRSSDGGTLVILTFYLDSHSPREPLLVHDPFHAITDAFFALDRSWRVTFANQKAADAFALSPGELIGRDVAEMLDGQLPEEVCERFRQVMAGAERASLEAYLPLIEAWVEARIYPAPEGIAVYFTDISERKRIEAELRRSEQLAKALGEIHLLLGSTLGRDPLLRRALVSTSVALEADWGAVLEKTDTGWPVRFMHGSHRGIPMHAAQRQPPYFTVVAESALSGVVSIPDVSADERLRTDDELGETRALLAVPVKSFGEVTGFVCFGFFAEQGEFAPSVLAFAEDLSRLLSLLLENVGLYEEKAYLAAYLQQALLTGPVEVPGVLTAQLYRSASERTAVGGDFWDVFALDADVVAVVVGDVCGHGLPAATTASLVKETIRTFAYEEKSAAAILARTDRALQKRSANGFTTVFLGLLSRRTGQMSYSSAGHPPQLLRRASGEVCGLAIGGLPLCAATDVRFPLNECRVETGDVLLLYTDGIVEAGQEGELFGEERLAALLSRDHPSLAAMVERIMNESEAFGHGRLRDDAVLVALSLAEERRL